MKSTVPVERTGVVEAAHCVSLLDVLAGEAERWVLHQMVLLLVEAIQVKEVTRHLRSRTGLGLGLEAQSAQEQTLDGLSHTGLQDRLQTGWCG